MKLSIIVPCYNEEENLLLILEKFNDVIKSKNIEVILVNNGSTDNSKQLLEKNISNYAFAKFINVNINQGYGFGITSGLSEAQGEFISYTHADMQTDPADVIKAYELIKCEADYHNCYVKGDRKGRPFIDQFFTVAMSFFESFYLGKKLWDINAQPNVFHVSFFERIKKNCPKDFSLDLYLLYMAKKHKLKIIRFDVLFPERIYGESSWNFSISSKIKFIKRTLDFSIKLKKEL